MKIAALGIAGFIAFVVIMFALTFSGQEWRRFFAPRSEAIRREVFEETRSYNQAKLQELANYRLQYMQADDQSDKDAIASTIQLRFSDYDGQRMPIELEQFLKEIRGW